MKQLIDLDESTIIYYKNKIIETNREYLFITDKIMALITKTRIIVIFKNTTFLKNIKKLKFDKILSNIYIYIYVTEWIKQ